MEEKSWIFEKRYYNHISKWINFQLIYKESVCKILQYNNVTQPCCMMTLKMILRVQLTVMLFNKERVRNRVFVRRVDRNAEIGCSLAVEFNRRAILMKRICEADDITVIYNYSKPLMQFECVIYAKITVNYNIDQYYRPLLSNFTIHVLLSIYNAKYLSSTSITVII